MIKYLFVTHPLFHFDFNGLYLSFSVKVKRKSVNEQKNLSGGGSVAEWLGRRT